MKRFRTLLFLSLLFSTAVNAQFVTNSKRVADVYFQNKEYYAAAEYYKKALKISSDSTGFVVPYAFDKNISKESPKRDEYEYCVYQLASSLRLYKNYKDAQAWYAIAVNFGNPKYALSTYWYAETLRANQQYAEAIPAFNAFLAKYKAVDEYTQSAKMEVASCNFALYEKKYPRLFQLTKLGNDINQKGSNYTPYIEGNSFYFTSSRPVAVSGKTVVLEGDQNSSKVAKKQSPFVNAIYEVSGSPMAQNVSLQKVAPIIKNNESAAPAIHPNGKIMYVTSWASKGTRKIYQLNAMGSGWSEPLELGAQVNINGYNAMQPFVSKDGKYFMFSSDKPGGFGRYDLWYCPILGDGSLGEAVNMGRQINTRDDEEAPYYNAKTGKLLFSSNGMVGLGGLDFYESTGDFKTWSEPINMGYPFNSSKDDVSFTPTKDDDSEGYISTDRASLCCLEIFYVKVKYLNIHGVVIDCKTSKPIDGAIVTVTDSANKTTLTAGTDGFYHFRVATNRKLTLKAEKADYFSKVLTYTYDQLGVDTMFSPEICLVPMVIDKPIVLKDIYYNFDSDSLREESKVVLDGLYKIMMDNDKIEIELSSHTDNIGTVEYNADLSARRAKSCVDYLISKGLSATRVTSKGYGFSKPVAANQFPDGKDNPDGRQLNRRTEFKVTKK